jgi:2,3-diketo-5-methylthio-1-phosphopentane phosphatase
MVSSWQNLEIFCDFDGTITTFDTVDFLLESLADPKWKAVEERWVNGEIGSKECMAQQIRLIAGGKRAIEQKLSEVSVDPSFREFAFWLNSLGIPLYVVSDGLDFVINTILRREGIKVDCVYANHLVERTDGGLELAFPNASGNCSSGVCKCKLLNNDGFDSVNVVIGDGRSDFCWSTTADILFAKSKLLDYCRQEFVACHEFKTFDDIRMCLEKLGVPALSGNLVLPPVSGQVIGSGNLTAFP